MLWRRLIACSFLCAVSLAAQAPPGAEESAKDRTDARFQQLQQALRERDAIIRNLLERVSELEKKTNISACSRRRVCAFRERHSAQQRSSQ